MENYSVCPNCKKEIKDGTFKSNQIVSGLETKFIKEMLDESSEVFCSSCSKYLISEAAKKLRSLLTQLNNDIKKGMGYIPILTTHSPNGWEYDSISIVTGQSVTGTGAISEFKSDFSDFFGGQSNSFNKKIANGEIMCFDQLRAKAVKMGANAVIATDIDYSEAGAAKGMLMVCAAGTAVNLKNTEILGAKKEMIEELQNNSRELSRLSKYNKFANK